MRTGTCWIAFFASVKRLRAVNGPACVQRSMACRAAAGTPPAASVLSGAKPGSGVLGGMDVDTAASSAAPVLRPRDDAKRYGGGTKSRLSS